MERRRTGRHQNILAQQIIASGAIQQTQLLQAAKTAASQEVPLIVFLVHNRMIEASVAAQIASRCYEMPLYDLSVHDPSMIVREFFNFDFVKKFYGLPIMARGDTLFIAITEPNIPELRNISFLTRRNVEFVLAEADKIRELIEKAMQEEEAKKSTQEMDAEKFMDELNIQMTSDLDEFQISTLEENESEEMLSSDDINDTPVVRFVNKIMIDAISIKASDIHFEPYERVSRVRYRLDGVLREVVDAPKKLTASIVARLKVMANLDISEHRIPQDGRFRLTVAKGHSIDVRVSTCPTVHGEKVVMRLLDPKTSTVDITSLGLNDLQKEALLHAINQSQGMILVTGPTGSGKTVSLYTALRILNTPEKNISTVEDPVEIYMQGINQVQVNQKAGLTFANSLRSFLRQDPDIIMVGEIRDLETAEIAIKAAQTGHLVLSTLHTNNAPLTIARLVSMGVPTFNITSSVTLVMAQRLVRRLCPHCKKPVKNSKEALLKAGLVESEAENIEIYEPGSCSRCHQGYKGRVGIYEVMPMSDEMNKLIMEGGNALDLEAQAKSDGMLSLREAGLEKVTLGITSIEEVDRVTIF